MKIVMTGGGSAGHITPILAVAHEVKQMAKTAQVIFIGQRGDSFADMPRKDKNIDKIYSVRAGKFRRYYGESIWQHIKDVGTWSKNIRDAIFVVMGLWQSFWLLGKIKPDVIFIKGGFVGVPVGLAAALRGIPYVTHDSDAMPGLANRIIAPWAYKHAVAMPKEVYNYPPLKTEAVGVPLTHYYSKVDDRQKNSYKKQLNIDVDAKVLLVTCGSQGSQRINKALLACVADLFERYPNLLILQIAGRANDAEKITEDYARVLPPHLQKRIVVIDFVHDLYIYSGAADVVLSRAGATSIAEFAAQAKPCVIVPSPFLTGGHQLKNAKILADRKAAKIVDEANLTGDPLVLMPALTELLDNDEQAKTLGENLHKFAVPGSAKRLASILLKK
jgi:UDP-N-acetylglucosamine--N-acetylmuramyl-(pentapeptide) pyrophosphoryl-undecaprenol N-acetylglucosamine transferase